MSKIENCLSCRFWLLDKKTLIFDRPVEEGDIAFGRCRRHAPKVIGELAALMVPRPAWRDGTDNEQDLCSQDLYVASPHPVTESADWCGEYRGEKGR